MSQLLRNRFSNTKDEGTSTSGEAIPAADEEVRLAPVSKILGTNEQETKHPHHKKEKTRKRRNGFIFALGGLFGILVAGFFAQKSDLIDLPELGDLSMDSLMDVLPANFMKEARDLAVSLSLEIALADADSLSERRKRSG